MTGLDTRPSWIDRESSPTPPRSRPRPSSTTAGSPASCSWWCRGAAGQPRQSWCSGSFAASSSRSSCPAWRSWDCAACPTRWRARSTTTCRTTSAASRSSSSRRATASPGSAIRRRAGSSTAPRSAASRAKSRARCCAAGTGTTASCSAIRGWASSAPNRRSTVSRGSRVTTSSTTTRSSPTSACVSRPAKTRPTSIRRGRRCSRARAGPRNGCAGPIATTRWTTCAPRCRWRSSCSVRPKVSTSRVSRRG